MAQPNVLFLVHGIGEQRGGWAEQPAQTLRTAAGTYDCFAPATDPLADQIEFVEIRYDDIFDLVLQRFSGLTSEFRQLDPALTAGTLDRVFAALRQPDSIAAQFAGDVLLYQLKLVSTTVLLRVMRRITETVAQIGRVHEGQPVKYGILGHSMGTTVVHDALQLLATQPLATTQQALTGLQQALPEFASDYAATFGNNPFSTANFQFDAVYMVSNTSRLLHTTRQGPYDSLVRPYNLHNSRAVCRSFYNIDHCWDPVSKVRPFVLAKAWSGHTDGAAQIDVEHVHHANVHALDHYLINPRVHSAIFLQLAPRFTRDALRTARERVDDDTFRRWGPGFDLEAKKQQIRQQLEARVQEALASDDALKVQELLRRLRALAEAYG